MPVTETSFVYFDSLRAAGSAGGIIVRLMMASNDISIANQSQAHYETGLPRNQRHVSQGARMYFVRLQLGHLNEALKIVADVRDSQRLTMVLARCSPKCQLRFDRLVECLPGGQEHSKFKKYIMLARHKIIFHYDAKMVQRAIEDRAERTEARRSKLTRGDHMNLWRFHTADDVLDSIICRQIWKIPRDADLRAEANRLAAFTHDLTVDYLEFAAALVCKFLGKK